MLKINNISTGYGKKQVLFDISLEVKQGEIVLLAGSNGSGKSTLLKAIYGMLPLWTSTAPGEHEKPGCIYFDGVDITGLPTALLLKKGLLYIPQKNKVFEDLTVKENLEMAGLLLNRKQLKGRIENVLGVFPILQPLLNRIPMKLSGGERQLLTIAMAMLHLPKMILFDEPFTGLSPQNIAFVADRLNEINQNGGISLVIVEHRVKECLSMANRIIGLKLGTVFIELEVSSSFKINQISSVFV